MPLALVLVGASRCPSCLRGSHIRRGAWPGLRQVRGLAERQLVHCPTSPMPVPDQEIQVKGNLPKLI
jgi:hypothetical protein